MYGSGRPSATVCTIGAAETYSPPVNPQFGELDHGVSHERCRLHGLRRREEVRNHAQTDEPAVRRIVAAVVSKHGRLDELVNAVGGYAAGRALWDLDAGVLSQMLSLNLTLGYILCCAVVPTMLRAPHIPPALDHHIHAQLDREKSCGRASPALV